MPQTVFYAWQSDLPNNTNRGFIRKAIEGALKEVNSELGVEEALRPDQDTQDTPGNPSVADTIYEKIDTCAIFVPDISIVTEPGAVRPIPNPNVMIEYGRATKSRGDQFIVPIFNEAYGNWRTDRPFDMRHKTSPITYNLSADHTPQQKATARKELTKRLVRAIKTILDTGLPQADILPSSEDFEPMRQRYCELWPKDVTTIRMIGFWCGLIPISETVSISRPFEHAEYFERQSFVQGEFPNSGAPLTLGTMDLLKDGLSVAHSVRPVQGGGERQWHRRCSGHPINDIVGEDVCLVRVENSGQVLVAVKTNYHNPAPAIYVSSIMADVANALRIAEQVRQSSSQPSLKFAMMLELRYDDHLDTVVPVEDDDWRFGFLNDEWPHAQKVMKSRPLTFGPFEVGSADHYPELMSLVMDEIYIAANKLPLDDFEFSI